MITLDDFYRTYGSFRPPPDPQQRTAIDEGPERALFIVAGPGTGKTTCLTLRILKLILVDDVPPQGIVATTFTEKAAAEFRARILGWGFKLIDRLANDRKIRPSIRKRISGLDINQIVTGTLDSICERLLRDYREPATQPPILADDFVARTLLLRRGLLDGSRFKDDDLDAFLLELTGGSRWGWNVARKADVVEALWERRFHDQLDWPAFLAAGGGSTRARRVLADAVAAYEAALRDRGLVDFSRLEQEVLDRIRAGKLDEFTRGLRVLVVDEYQDTNLLQESIYFELARAANCALSIVGDDDQSLYRFRGATVELFRDFPRRYKKALRRAPQKIFLTTNYRSSRAIVDLVNAYVGLDEDYQDVRVAGKPALDYRPEAPQGTPILGMFREDAEALARDLGQFLHSVFRGKGHRLPDGTRIERGREGGDVGDCALLCSSPAEYSAGDKPRLPLLLRDDLRARVPAIEIFNPRGQDLTSIDVVAHFGGLLLRCLDPDRTVQESTAGLTPDARAVFDVWRDRADQFLLSAPRVLISFVNGWSRRSPNKPGLVWPRTVSVLDLIYGLTHFFPALYDDPEGQVYLEVFTRQVSACELLGGFKGRVVTDPSAVDKSQSSVRELLRDFLGPIAGGTIKVNEELVQTFPRDRLSILSIHQAKGLEFPLVIVDVGSDFQSRHAAHAFKRFPRAGGPPHAMEDLLRPFSDLGSPARPARDRAFDDLYRQFFVAYSRPRDLLLLVGLTATSPGGPVENVATGWTREANCRWAPSRPYIAI